MTDKTVPDMHEVFQRAAEIAQHMPENIQVAAFNRALDFLTKAGAADALEGQKHSTLDTSRNTLKAQEAKASIKHESPVAAIMPVIDTIQHPVVGYESSRPGTKQILETLIEDSFFDSPRDITQMIEHIRHSHGRTYKATDLSPALTRLMREDKLDRTKNNKGIYEYVIHR